MNKIKILKYALISLSLLTSFLAWQSVDRAINVVGSSIWWMPIFFFSLLFVLIYLSIVLIRRMIILQAMLLFIFSMSFFFAFSFGHLVIMILAYLFALWSITRIKRDLHLNVKLSLWKSIRSGSAYMLVAFAILITSQYYVEIKNMSSVNIIPKFSIAKGSMASELISGAVATFYPESKKIDQDGLTVDDFILQQMQQRQNQDTGGVDGIDNEISRMQQQLMIQEARKNFSEAAGIKLNGSEKVSDVISDSVNNLISRYLVFGLPESGESSPMLIVIIIGLFLTLLSMGALFGIAWIIAVEIIIWIFIKTEVITIAKVPVEMEIIEQE